MPAAADEPSLRVCTHKQTDHPSASPALPESEAALARVPLRHSSLQSLEKPPEAPGPVPAARVPKRGARWPRGLRWGLFTLARLCLVYVPAVTHLGAMAASAPTRRRPSAPPASLATSQMVAESEVLGCDTPLSPGRPGREVVHACSCCLGTPRSPREPKSPGTQGSQLLICLKTASPSHGKQAPSGHMQ